MKINKKQVIEIQELLSSKGWQILVASLENDKQNLFNVASSGKMVDNGKYIDLSETQRLESIAQIAKINEIISFPQNFISMHEFLLKEK